MKRFECPACFEMHTKGKPAFLVDGGEIRAVVVCVGCAARAVPLVVVDRAGSRAAALKPWADHLRKLALVYERDGSDDRAGYDRDA